MLKKQHSTKFNLHAYDIKFQSVFSKKEISEAFFEFLKTEFNTEPFLCIKDIEELKTIKNHEDTIHKIKYISDTYINVDSPLEINLSGFTRYEPLQKLKDSQQLENMDSWVLEESPYELFSTILRVLVAELNHDNFPRFARLKTVESLYSKYKDDPEVMVYRTAKRFPYTNESFTSKMISDDDFLFCDTLLVDSYDWDLILNVKDPNVKVYSANVDFLPYSSLFKDSYCFKMVSLIPANIEAMACRLFTSKYRNEIVENTPMNIINSTYLDTKQLRQEYPKERMKHDRVSCLLSFEVSGVFPLANRKTSIVETIEYDDEKNEIVYLHKCLIPEYLQNKDVDFSKKQKLKFTKNGEEKEFDGYFVCSLHFVKLKKIDNDTTLVHQIKGKHQFEFFEFSVANPRGNLGGQTSLVKHSAQIFGKIAEKKFKYLREISKDLNFKNCEKELMDDPLTASLLQQMSQYQKKQEKPKQKVFIE